MGVLVRSLCLRHLRYFCQGTGHTHRLSVCRPLSTESRSEKPGIFERVLHSFPGGVQMAFAYGSGVFQQTGHEMSKNMLDFIFVVEDPVQWHRDNLISNASHYSFLSILGPRAIARYQEVFGAGVYFNTLVPFEERLIKYGVISNGRLVQDLTEWDSMYISGRLHKPVRMIKQPSCPKVQQALKSNLKSALHASLLLLPETFTEEELFIQLTSLSYSGDFRMQFGEDKGKVKKIVTPNHQHFCNLYQTCIENETHLQWDREGKKFSQDISRDSKQYHLKQLPKSVVLETLKVIKAFSMGYELQDNTFFLEIVAKRIDCEEIVASSLANIVTQSSYKQSAKSIWTAGFAKSVQYSSSKVSKMNKGLKEN